MTTPDIAANTPVIIGGMNCPILNCIKNMMVHSMVGRIIIDTIAGWFFIKAFILLCFNKDNIFF